MQRTLWMYIAEECASDLHIPPSLIQLEILLGDSVARKIMYAESRDIVLTCVCASSFHGGKKVHCQADDAVYRSSD